MALPIQELGPPHGEALKAFLAQDMVPNLFLLGVLEEFGLAPKPGAPPFRFYGRIGATGKLSAVLFVGGEGGLWVPVGSPEDTLAIISTVHQLPPVRSAVGQRPAVDALVTRLCRPQPRIFRAQKLMAVSADDLGPFTNPTLRLARRSEVSAVVPLAAGAVEALTGKNPLELDAAGFEHRVARRIEAKRTYVLEVGSRLVFKVDLGSRSEYGAELEGLYTLPECRNQGHATLSLGQICRHLLSSLPRLTLRVDEDSQLERISHKVGFLSRRAMRLAIS